MQQQPEQQRGGEKQPQDIPAAVVAVMESKREERFGWVWLCTKDPALKALTDWLVLCLAAALFFTFVEVSVCMAQYMIDDYGKASGPHELFPTLLRLLRSAFWTLCAVWGCVVFTWAATIQLVRCTRINQAARIYWGLLTGCFMGGNVMIHMIYCILIVRAFWDRITGVDACA